MQGGTIERDARHEDIVENYMMQLCAGKICACQQRPGKVDVVQGESGQIGMFQVHAGAAQPPGHAIQYMLPVQCSPFWVGGCAGFGRYRLRGCKRSGLWRGLNDCSQHFGVVFDG